MSIVSSEPVTNWQYQYEQAHYAISDLQPRMVSCEVGLGEVSSRQVKFVQFPNIAVAHCCSTRVGGTSSGPYAGLNIGQTTSDVPKRVHNNRLLLAKSVGVPLVSILTMVHGNHVVVVDKLPKSLRVGDACITMTPGIPMMITTADCVPVLYYDPDTGAVGLAHAGWRGTVAGVASATALAMREHFGSNLANLQVAIGPSIGPCCFEVGIDTAEQFENTYPGQELVKTCGNRTVVDLWRANWLELVGAGVNPQHICVSRLCTACHSELFFSYRRDKQVTGRMAAVIGISPGL